MVEGESKSNYVDSKNEGSANTTTENITHPLPDEKVEFNKDFDTCNCIPLRAKQVVEFIESRSHLPFLSAHFGPFGRQLFFCKWPHLL